MKKHLVFWALCLCGAPACGLGYGVGVTLVGTEWAGTLGGLVALATLLGAVFRYERLNDVFGLQHVIQAQRLLRARKKRLAQQAKNIGAGAGAVLLTLALPGGGLLSASINPSSASPEALEKVVAEVEALEVLAIQHDDDSEGCTSGDQAVAVSGCFAALAAGIACKSLAASVGPTGGVSLSVAISACAAAIHLLTTCIYNMRCA